MLLLKDFNAAVCADILRVWEDPQKQDAGALGARRRRDFRRTSGADYLPARYWVHMESMRAVWPVENRSMQKSSV